MNTFVLIVMTMIPSEDYRVTATNTFGPYTKLECVELVKDRTDAQKVPGRGVKVYSEDEGYFLVCDQLERL